MTSALFATVVERHTRSDADRDDGGALGTDAGNLLSAFELVHDAFGGIETTDRAGISARVNARNNKSGDRSPTGVHTHRGF